MAQPKYVDWDGLVYYDGKIKDYIAQRDTEGIKMGGIIPFAELPDPSFSNVNYIYKITDKFTSNEDFEKPNLIYKAGTWVQCANINDTYYYIIFNDNELEGDTPVTPGGDVDLSNYYTKDETNQLVEDINTDIDSLSDEVDSLKQTASELETAINSNTDAIDGLSIEIANTESKVDELETKIDSIKVPTKVSELDNDAGYLTEHQDLSEYAKKTDIPGPELFVVDFNAPDFAAALEAYNSGKLLLLTNAAPDPDSYAVMNYVRDDMITFTKFLMSRSGTYGSFNTYYLHNDSDNPWELAKEVKLNKVDAVVDDNNDITGLTIGKNTYDLDHFATTETVNQITENIENTYVTNTTLEETKQEIANTYVTEQYVTNNYITQEAASETYVTNEEVTTVVETQVNEVVTKEIETKVETVIQEKIDAGEITVNADSINYDTW